MNNWEKSIILQAFKVHFGLQESLKHLDSPNKNFKKEVLYNLSVKTGLRPRYLREHIEEIKAL